MMDASSIKRSAARVPLKSLALLLAVAVVAGCAAPATSGPSASAEICDIKEPSLGSRVAQKVPCEPKKPLPAPAS